MAIAWMDGCDIYAAQADLGVNYSVSGWSISTTGSNWGSGCFTNDGNSSRYIARIGSFALNIWTSFRLRGDDNSNQDQGFVQIFGQAGSPECTITLNPGLGVLKVWRGPANTGTLLGTVTVVGWSINVWHWFDIHYVYHASAGVVEVWMDDVQVANLTAQNTANNASQTVLGTVALASGLASSGNTVSGKYDDWIINDTTGSYNTGRMGDTRIETLVPTSDASPNQATPSTGVNHYAVVDEPQYNTSDYLTMANTSGNEELFGAADLSGTPAVVKAVCVRMMSQKSDAGAYSLKPLVVSNSVEVDGAAQPLSVTWTAQQSIFEADPNTSAAWTYSAVNAAQIGYKVP